MKSLTVLIITVGLIQISALSTLAQQPSVATKEHQWLKQFVGEWQSSSKAHGPGMPDMEGKGTMKARMLGELWTVIDYQADFGGMNMTAVQTIGYDAEKKKYVGSWVDSFQNILWTYDGTVDASGKKITLEAEGPNMMEPGKRTKFRDEYEFVSPEKMTITSSMLGSDGNWVTFMSGEAQRKK
jgi:hypothetical protein